MCAAFHVRFDGLPNVQVFHQHFEDLKPHDCFVTAANSVGIMTDGIDAAVVRYFGEDIMRRVQYRMIDEYLGEQPVGTAFIFPTGGKETPFLCHAPTMRVPGSIGRSDKVYSATWAAFFALSQHNVHRDQKIETVAFSAFGAGFGGAPFSEVARHMAAAYRHFLLQHTDWIGTG